MDKKTLNERDICTKFITPALRQAGWDQMPQFCEKVSFTKGRIIVRGKPRRSLEVGLSCSSFSFRNPRFMPVRSMRPV